ncbi:MAG: hypothetical protein CL746_05480 [Chloroflexi bacterium]|nr:hypothetical protein [Chloroflexota bacterium]
MINNNFKIPGQISLTIIPLSLLIMGDSILYVLLPANGEFFRLNSFLGLPNEFWIGFLLSINRIVRFFTNIFSVKIYKRFGFRNTIFIACVLGASSTLFYAVLKGVILLFIARIIWGFSYSLFRLGYQLRVFSYPSNNFGKYLGYCVGVQRTGSFLVVTLGVLASIKFGINVTLISLSILLIPALFISYFIKEIDLSKLTSKKINWNLAYNDQPPNLSKKIIMVSLFKFTSSFSSNGLAIATIIPFLVSVEKNLLELDTIVGIAGFIIGFRHVADIFFGVIFGSISDRFGRKINILISTFLMIVAIIIAITGLNFYLSVFCLVLMFFFSVSLETSLDALLGQLSPEQEKSSIVSRYSTWQDIGAAMGPLVGFMIAIGYGVQFGYIVSIFMFSICLYGFYRLFLRD